MRLQLSKFAVIISFIIYTIAATNRPRNFVCDRKYFPADEVSKSFENSCHALKYADISCKFIAALDGSELFGISDAVLFSVPTKVSDNYQYKGGNLLQLETITYRVNSRFILDSMCNLIGLVYLKKRNFIRCAETIDSDHVTRSASDVGSQTLLKNYGYRCNNKIFHYRDIMRSFEHLRLLLSEPEETTKHLKPIKYPSDDIPGGYLYLWPVYSDGTFKIISHSKPGPYRIATNKDKDMIGLMYRKNQHWYRCIEMQSIDPNPRTVGDGTKNSIGETIFDNISPHTCGHKYFSVITLNSHMQAACRVIKEDANEAVSGRSSYPIPDPAARDGERKTVFWPLRIPELDGDKKGYGQRFSYIKLDLDCKFLGVYKRVNGNFFPCLKH